MAREMARLERAGSTHVSDLPTQSQRATSTGNTARRMRIGGRGLAGAGERAAVDAARLTAMIEPVTHLAWTRWAPALSVCRGDEAVG